MKKRPDQHDEESHLNFRYPVTEARKPMKEKFFVRL